jgi:aryl-alcohol dehydrogenase-like predicted oxidoreductase
MRYKLLGNTGMKVSELCLGTMSFGSKWGFGADRGTSIEIAGVFAEAGGNFLDTATSSSEPSSGSSCRWPRPSGSRSPPGRRLAAAS